MRSPGSSLRLGLFLFLVVVADISFACAGEGDRDVEHTESDAAVDASHDTGDLQPSPDLDSGADAGRCSAAGLCVTTVPIDRSINLVSVRGSSAADVWAVGTSGTVLHFDGSVWEKGAPVAADGPAPFTLRSVWLDRPDDVWVTDGSRIRHSTGWKGPAATEWSLFVQGPPLSALVGNGSAVWLARGWPAYRAWQSPLLRLEGWNDGGPERIAELGPTFDQFGFELNAIAASGSDEIWAVGRRVLRAYRSESEVEPDAASLGWEVEEHESLATQQLLGVWGDERTVWLVGEGGAIRRLNRNQLSNRRFEIFPGPTTSDLRGIFGFGASDVWAVGDESTVLHWDGTSWTKLSTPFDDAPDKPNLFSVWGSSPSDVWIAGNGTMLHLERSAP